MSVYRHKGSPHYHFDFQVRGRRFHGSTGTGDRREAEKLEQGEREKAKALSKSDRGTGPHTYGEAAARFWNEVGKHCATATEIRRHLVWLGEAIGEQTPMEDLDSNLVSKIIAKRRGEHRWGRKDLALVSPATVNRSVTEPLQKIFTRARLHWGCTFTKEPVWQNLMLKEPDEHVRELRQEEADAIEVATRSDYQPFFAFARATGFRLRECLVKWSEVDWANRQIVKKGKGGRTVMTPITSQVASILTPLIGHHLEWVFTYVCQRPRDGRVKGHRRPITYSGAKIVWRRLRARAGVVGFRFHDFRHDLGTKLLRETGNLKLVQKVLNHRNIKTTSRYAHVHDDEVAVALEKMQKSRNKSRIKKRKAG